MSIRFRQVTCLHSFFGSARLPRAPFVESQERFPDEAACLEYLANPAGLRDIAARPAAMSGPGCWSAGTCGSALAVTTQTSVTAGTVMHGTRTPFRLWFWAAYLVATHAPGIGGFGTIRINPQMGLKSVTYTNVQTTGKPEEVTLHTFILNIEYSWERPASWHGFQCHGFYKGTLTARATTGNLTIEDTA